MLVALPSLICACSAGRMDVVGVTNNSLQLGLVAHWSCDEEGGGTLVDHSGNGHDGAVAGASWISGCIDGALHFDAGNSVTVSSFPQASSSWSVALWYRAPSGDFGDSYLTLISTEDVFAGGWAMNVRLTPSDPQYHFGFSVGSDAGDLYEHYETNRVDVDRWVHLVAVVDGQAMRLEFYKDGELMGGSALSHLIQPGNTHLYLGRWVGFERLLVGDLDDIVIFNRALVQAEVRELYARAAPTPR